MNVRFDEKQYKNTHKIYWHGSQVEDYEVNKSSWGMFYMSNSFEYAVRYARKPDNHWGYMFACSISGNLNIFNALNELDKRKLVNHLLRKGYFDNIRETELFIEYKLTRKDWLQSVGEETRKKLLQILIDLGYDGFFNYEIHSHNLSTDNPSIGLFDTSLFIIRKKLNEEEIEDYIKKDRKLNDIKMSQVEQYKSGNPRFNKSLLSYDDLSRIKRNSREEYIKELKEDLNKWTKLLKEVEDPYDIRKCEIVIRELEGEINDYRHL